MTAEAVHDATSRLGRAAAEDFDAELAAVYALVGPLLDMVALGDNEGAEIVARWTESSITPDEASRRAARLATIGTVDGIVSLTGDDGAMLVAPHRPGDGSVVTFAIAAPGVEIGADTARWFGLLTSVVAEARHRAEADADLRSELDRQEFLAELSTSAATDDANDETLQMVLERARDTLGVTAASTLVRDGAHFVLVATTDFLGSRPVEIGTRLAADMVDPGELTHTGHAIRGFGLFETTLDAFPRPDGEVLCVPRFGPDGVEGMVVFADVDGRKWGSSDIAAAKSIARSVQKLTLRTQLERAERRRHELDRMLRDVGAVAARASIENFDEVLREAMEMVLETFDVRGVELWAADGGRVERLAGRWRDVVDEPGSASLQWTLEMRGRLVDDGYALVPVRDLAIEGPVRELDNKALIVPAGTDPSGVLVLTAHDRWWSADDLVAARALAHLADRTRARLVADTVVHSRLRAEAFRSSVAAIAVDVVPENVDERLARILTECVVYFGVSEASIWRLGNRRAAVARRGQHRTGHTLCLSPASGPGPSAHAQPGDDRRGAFDAALPGLESRSDIGA